MRAAQLRQRQRAVVAATILGRAQMRLEPQQAPGRAILQLMARGARQVRRVQPRRHFHHKAAVAGAATARGQRAVVAAAVPERPLVAALGEV